MKPVRVLHIITRLVKGGAQEIVLSYLRELCKDPAFEIELAYGRTLPHEAEGDILHLYREIPNLKLHYVPALIRELSPLRDWSAYRAVKSIIRDGNFDILHTHTSKAGALGRQAAGNRLIKFHSPHSHIFYGYFSDFKTKIFIAVERYCAKKTDVIFALTPQEVEDHLRLRVGRREQFRVLPSGIDMEPFLTADKKASGFRREFGIDDESPLLACIARLVPVKGHDTLLEAFKIIHDSLPNAKLALIGGGETEAALREHCDRLALRDSVLFCGIRDDIPNILSASDLAVLASRNEGFGMFLVEASASGLPVIASKVGGIPYVIRENEGGLLVEAEKPELFAKACLELLRNPHRMREMGQKGRDYVKDRYSLSSCVKILKNEYLEQLRIKNAR